MGESKKELDKDLEQLSKAVSDASSDDVQDAMIEQAIEHSKDVVEQAANAYAMTKDRFFAHLPHFNKKQLLRLVKSLTEYPIQDTDYNHGDGREKEAFLLGRNALESKFTMIFYNYFENMNKIQKQAVADEMRNAAEKNEMTEGDNDGEKTS